MKTNNSKLKPSFFTLLFYILIKAAPTFAAEFNINDYHPIPGKKVVCTMTLNSSDEKNAFIKHSESIGEAVDYVELAPSGNFMSRNEWLQQSCDSLQQKNVNCDELIVSAHFGPNLYGKSRKIIDLEFLEKMSCEGACSNLFSQLKKTYLFACNTLSGNTDDHRRAENQDGMSSQEKASSQQNYVAIQMGHDASRSWAEEASESRYGKYGSGGSFGDRFLRVFSNLMPGNEIYGFTTVDNSGANIAPIITRALAKNIPLEVALRNNDMIKKSGALNEEARHLKAVSCQLSKYSDDPDEIMRNIIDYYSTTKDAAHEKLFPKIIQFIMDHYTTNHVQHDDDVERPDINRNAWRTDLSQNSSLKEFVLNGLNEKIFPSSTRMTWSTFAYKLGWISNQELKNNLAQGLFGLMRPPYNSESSDDVLFYAKIFPESVKALNMTLLPKSLRDNPEAKSILRRIYSFFPDETDTHLQEWAGVMIPLR